MTKVATTPIYDKNPVKVFFSGTDGPMAMGLGMRHWEHGPIIVCTHDDPGLTLTYCMAWSNFDLLYGMVEFGPVCFGVGKSDNNGFFRNLVMKFAIIGHNDKRYLLTSKSAPQGYSTCPRAPSVRPLSTKIFFSEATGQIEAELHMQPPWVGEQKFIRTVWVTIPKWPPCPYMVKNALKFFFSITNEPMTIGLGISCELSA